MNKQCEECGKFFSGKQSRKFCSQSCSASYNNRKYPKRKKTHRRLCPDCGKIEIHHQTERCMLCHRRYLLNKQLDRTLNDCIRDKYDSSLKYMWIRKIAQRVLELSLTPKKCKVCEFDIVDVCHIKPISKFSLNTKLKEINSKDNLIYLCPNHHALLHAGRLEL